MKSNSFFLMLFMSIKVFSQECPCVKAAIIGTDTSATSNHNNRVIAMDSATIAKGESINLYTKESTGKITWYKDEQLLDNTLVMPTETTEYTVKSVLTGCPDAVAGVLIKVQKNTIEEISNDISIYPNPANDMATISSANRAIKSIKITNLSGRNIMAIRFSTNLKQQTINISDLTTGVYLLSIETEGNNTITKKLIKN